MKKLIKTAFFSLIVLLPYSVLAAEGLVKCGVKEGSSCGFVDLIALIHNIINWVMIIAPSLAALTFAYAGFLYMSSSANPSKKDEAHKIFTTTLIGLLVILAAWLIIKAILTGLDVTGDFNLLT